MDRIDRTNNIPTTHPSIRIFVILTSISDEPAQNNN